MEVDLSTLEAGQTVRFRCGGESVVEETRDKNHGRTSIRMRGDSYDKSFSYSYNGFFSEHGLGLSPFDIIKIIPKPFDWKDVKPGMAFNQGDEIVYFVGHDFLEHGWVVTNCSKLNIGQGSLYVYKSTELTRSPGNDINVPS